jgi:hypothetical protein
MAESQTKRCDQNGIHENLAPGPEELRQPKPDSMQCEEEIAGV